MPGAPDVPPSLDDPEAPPDSFPVVVGPPAFTCVSSAPHAIIPRASAVSAKRKGNARPMGNRFVAFAVTQEGEVFMCSAPVNPKDLRCLDLAGDAVLMPTRARTASRPRSSPALGEGARAGDEGGELRDATRRARVIEKKARHLGAELLQRAFELAGRELPSCLVLGHVREAEVILGARGEQIAVGRADRAVDGHLDSAAALLEFPAPELSGRGRTPAQAFVGHELARMRG